MTTPNTPEGVLTRAAQRIAATREATRALAEEVRAKRAADAATADGQAATSEGGQP